MGTAYVVFSGRLGTDPGRFETHDEDRGARAPLHVRVRDLTPGRDGTGHETLVVDVVATGAMADRLEQCTAGEHMAVAGGMHVVRGTDDGRGRRRLQVLAESLMAAGPALVEAGVGTPDPTEAVEEGEAQEAPRSAVDERMERRKARLAARGTSDGEGGTQGPPGKTGRQEPG